MRILIVIAACIATIMTLLSIFIDIVTSRGSNEEPAISETGYYFREEFSYTEGVIVSIGWSIITAFLWLLLWCTRTPS
jgi:hypothetical protein